MCCPKTSWIWYSVLSTSGNGDIPCSNCLDHSVECVITGNRRSRGPRKNLSQNKDHVIQGKHIEDEQSEQTEIPLFDGKALSIDDDETQFVDQESSSVVAVDIVGWLIRYYWRLLC